MPALIKIAVFMTVSAVASVVTAYISHSDAIQLLWFCMVAEILRTLYEIESKPKPELHIHGNIYGSDAFHAVDIPAVEVPDGE